MTSMQPRWLSLEGTANTRDVGGIPARGGPVRPGVLIRSDNLQSLSAADVEFLVERIGVRTVLDLRTDSERRDEGPGPLAIRTKVRHLSISVLPEEDLAEPDANVVLPDRWRDGPVNAYLHYLRARPDAFARAIRELADPHAGASIVHCAAGKDRTGVLVALALDVVGTSREDIVADYARTNERIEAIFARLAASSTYALEVTRIGLDSHRVEAATMDQVLAILSTEYGSPAAYLRAAGVTDGVLDALHRRLVG